MREYGDTLVSMSLNLIDDIGIANADLSSCCVEAANAQVLRIIYFSHSQCHLQFASLMLTAQKVNGTQMYFLLLITLLRIHFQHGDI